LTNETFRIELLPLSLLLFTYMYNREI